MKTKAKIIIGVSSVFVLITIMAIAAVVGFFLYVDHKLQNPALKQKVSQAKADGTVFGKTTDQNGCMEKGFSLETPTDSFDSSNETFLNACLNSSRPTDDFCEGVPFVFDRKWFDEQCRKAGHNTEQCVSAFIAKRNYCRMGEKK